MFPISIVGYLFIEVLGDLLVRRCNSHTSYHAIVPGMWLILETALLIA